MEANDATNNGPGPLRHPRPLTAAELHLELEKEQEAVVNRLSRELAALRQQTASVASTASSSSAQDGPDITSGHIITGPAHPTASRQHRSSSNLSRTSLGALRDAPTVSGITPARDAPTQQTISGRGRSSRQNSVTTRRPESTSMLQHIDGAHSASATRSLSGVSSNIPSAAASPSNVRSPNRQSLANSSHTRYEDVASQRSELEKVRRENDALRQRVQELERALQQHTNQENAD